MDIKKQTTHRGQKHVVVLVLGDLGRSPRMQYQAYSIASLNKGRCNHPGSIRVSLIGYEGERVMPMVAENRSIEIFRLKQWDLPFLRFIPLLHAVAKGIALVFSILAQLLSLEKFDLVVVQNPPCLPALVALLALQFFYTFDILLDWHNLGYAMFQERLGEKHILVRLARALEKFLTSWVDFHCCVSLTMSRWLKDNFNQNAVVLYDKPPRMFMQARSSTRQRHELLHRLNLTKTSLFPHLRFDNEGGLREETIQTFAASKKEGKRTVKKYYERPVISTTHPAVNRVALVMSCTSWTPDEDFNILLDALVRLEQTLVELDEDGLEFSPVRGFRRVAVVITGKGPMKQQFEERVAQLMEQKRLGIFVAVRTAWLAPEDYPALLRCADLGVSLHTSTSGLDLPMKVLDMFGSGVPVCAVAFSSLYELVRFGTNGFSFEDAEGLEDQITSLLVEPRENFKPWAEDANMKDLSEYWHWSGTIKRPAGVAPEPQPLRGAELEIATLLPELHHMKQGTARTICWEDNWESVMGVRIRFILFNAKIHEEEAVAEKVVEKVVEKVDEQ